MMSNMEHPFINPQNDTTCYQTSAGNIVSNWRAEDGRSLQPIIKAKDGVIRFKGNAIIIWLLESGKLDLNQIAAMDFPKADEEQLAQLLGYSVSGFGDLSYASKKAIQAADVAAGFLL